MEFYYICVLGDPPHTDIPILRWRSQEVVLFFFGYYEFCDAILMTCQLETIHKRFSAFLSSVTVYFLIGTAHKDNFTTIVIDLCHWFKDFIQRKLYIINFG